MDSYEIKLIPCANGWTVSLGDPRDYYVFETWEKCEAFIVTALRAKRDAMLRKREGA